MSITIHERPGVYTSYDASSVIRGGRAVKIIGVAAKAVSGTPNVPVTLTSYQAGIAAFGEDAADAPGMSTILRLLFRGGASTVIAAAVDSAGDYASAFAALEAAEGPQILLCDSAELAVQQKLKSSVESSSGKNQERIAVIGMSGAQPTALVERAEALNSERMVLVGPDVVDDGGKPLSGVFAAAAVAAAIAMSRDPAIPLNGAPLRGLAGVSTVYSDNDIDLLVRGGVTPLESLGGVVSPVRGITTRTKTGSVQDMTWRELTTILVVDDVIPTIRRDLRARFSRTKNTVQTRGAIRAQVIVDLEDKLKAQIIDGYGDVSVSVSGDDPTICLVEFGFAVAHGLNQIHITAHITI